MYPPDTFEPLVVPGRFSSLSARLDYVVDALPDAVALVGDRTLTYRDLAREIDRLAGRLLEQLPPGDEPVGVLLPHDTSVVLTPLALMRLDRVFLILDPAAPAARLADIVELSGIRACVTNGELAGLLADAERPLTLILDDGATADVALPVPARADQDPVFVVFTSGSTGRPKGVLETHAQMLNDAYVMGYGETGYRPGDRITLLFPMAFVGGPVSVFSGFLNGATLYLFDARSSTPRAILDFVKRSEITVLGFAPHLLRAALEALAPGETLPTVRHLATGGEGIMGQDVEALRARLSPRNTYMNGMGSSEATTISALIAPAGVALAPGTVPAGRPTPNRDVWVVREDGSRAEVGETGQIMAVSHYLSGGYYRNDAANREKFGVLPDGRRTYLQGDLGRYDADGVLTLVGRADTAVKVRGYLVDLSEIEDALRSNDNIVDALVIAETEPGRPTRLIAYVAQRAYAIPDSVAEIRRGLRSVLPAYMVPSAIVPMAALPRNERGKVDRTRLPKPVEADVDDTGYTQHQLVVAGIWGNVLGLEKVPLDGDFLALGGDSLSVEEMLADIEERFGLALASSDLMAAPTLEEFAALVEAGSENRRTHPDVVPLRSGPAERRVFCFAGAGALALQFLPVARHLAGWEVHGVQAHALEHRGLPDRTLPAQAARAVADIRRIQPHGPYRLVGHSYGGLVALEAAHLLRAAGERVDSFTAIDTFLPYSEGMEEAYLQLDDPDRRRIVPERTTPVRDRVAARLAVARARHTTPGTPRPPCGSAVCCAPAPPGSCASTVRRISTRSSGGPSASRAGTGRSPTTAARS